MHSLRQDGFRKVSEGITTVEEVLRVTETETTRPAEGRQP
jgi:type II secretory ATPase GspE/PulE/Tfp pilus assembly ATPase PilB-like protein